MSYLKLLLAILLLTGIAGVGTAALGADGILLKVRAGESNYCHMKFPAIRENTLNWARPVLKAPSSGDIIDFYGPCNYNPVGKTAVQAQKLQLQRQHRRNNE